MKKHNYATALFLLLFFSHAYPAGEEVYKFAQNAAQDILNGNYVTVLVAGGALIVVGSSIKGGGAIVKDGYVSIKNLLHRSIWGPTKEDLMIAHQITAFEQEIESKKNLIKEQKEYIKAQKAIAYAAIMNQRIMNAENEAEKIKLKDDLSRTLTSLSDSLKSKIINPRNVFALNESNHSAPEGFNFNNQARFAK